MVKDRVTKADLDKFNVGDQKVFTLPSWSKARSAQSYANQLKKSEGKVFKTTIGDRIEGTEQFSVTIIRIA